MRSELNHSCVLLGKLINVFQTCPSRRTLKRHSIATQDAGGNVPTLHLRLFAELFSCPFLNKRPKLSARQLRQGRGLERRSSSIELSRPIQLSESNFEALFFVLPTFGVHRARERRPEACLTFDKCSDRYARRMES